MVSYVYEIRVVLLGKTKKIEHFHMLSSCCETCSVPVAITETATYAYLNLFMGGMAVKRMPPRYGSSVLSRVRYALPPVVEYRV